jgi:hypothetical protein
MPRVLVTAVLVRGTRRIRVAQDDGKSPVDRREHEASGDEGAKAQHRQDERRSPVARTSGSQPALSLAHRRTKMPHRMKRIKWGVLVRTGASGTLPGDPCIGRTTAFRSDCRTPLASVARPNPTSCEHRGLCRATARPGSPGTAARVSLHTKQRAHSAGDALVDGRRAPGPPISVQIQPGAIRIIARLSAPRNCA